MSVSTMEKLTVVVASEHAELLLSRLMRLRAVSLIDAREQAPGALRAPENDVGTPSARAARVDAVLPVLRKRAHRKFSLFAPVARVDMAEFRAGERYVLAWKVVEEAERILAGTAELRAEREQLSAQMRAYAPYLDWNRRLDFSGTPHTVALLGVLPSGTQTQTVLEALEDRAVVAQPICNDNTGFYLFVLVHREEEEQVRRALSGIGFLQAAFPDKNGTAKELFDRAGRRCAEIENELQSMETRLCSLSERLTEIEILSDVEHSDVMREQHKAHLCQTQSCTVLRAWCPTQHKARVTHMLERMGAAYEFAPPAADEQPPILLQNNAFARNFEWVLGMYAYPAYGKFDPTFVMSIFYMLIFGLMFADAGYGLLLSAVCFAVVRWCKPREGMKRFLLMFGYCGLSCIVFGVLFGAYFGDFPLAFLKNVVGVAPENLPNLALMPSTAANVAVLFDPLQNPMGFLIISLAVGAVHLLAGMAVQAYILCRRGKVLDALFDVGSYYVLFAGMGVFFLHKTVGIVLLCVGVAAILLTQGRSRKGIAGKLIGGFGGLYNLINYASDLLSYSRILALGLAAGVVGQVVNILATLKGAGRPPPARGRG